MEGYDTHPYGELRAIAIDLFRRSQTFAKLLGRSGGELSEAQTERHVARLLRLMNPSVMERGLDREDLAEFMILASHAVAEASLGVNAAERKALRKIARGHVAARARVDAMTFEEGQLRVVELAEVLRAALPVEDRAGILQDLAVIARADGRVSPRERAVLRELDALLGLVSEQSEEALAPADAELD
ncbi:MAG: TerB family tellurite resistance protein [Polyangiales bacterium]